MQANFGTLVTLVNSSGEHRKTSETSPYICTDRDMCHNELHSADGH